MALNSAERSEKLRLTRKKKLDGVLSLKEQKRLDDLESRTSKYSSASERITHVEERSSVEATGDAAALAAKAEGVRTDYLVGAATEGLVRCAQLHEKMSSMMLDRVTTMMDRVMERTGTIMEGQASLMASVNHHFLERTRAEGELMKLMNKVGEDEGSAAEQALGEFFKAMIEGMKQAKAKTKAANEVNGKTRGRAA